jgi:hypothetical protein
VSRRPRRRCARLAWRAASRRTCSPSVPTCVPHSAARSDPRDSPLPRSPTPRRCRARCRRSDEARRCPCRRRRAPDCHDAGYRGSDRRGRRDAAQRPQPRHLRDLHPLHVLHLGGGAPLQSRCPAASATTAFQSVCSSSARRGARRGWSRSRSPTSGSLPTPDPRPRSPVILNKVYLTRGGQIRAASTRQYQRSGAR